MSEIAVVAISVAKPGYEERLREALEGIVGPTRKEQGALQYDLHRDMQEPRRFVFFRALDKSGSARRTRKVGAHHGLQAGGGRLGRTRGDSRGVENSVSLPGAPRSAW